MNARRSMLHVLATYPENYLQRESVLFIEFTNNFSGDPLTEKEVRDLLNELERERLVVSQRVAGVPKWRITGSGRAALKES